MANHLDNEVLEALASGALSGPALASAEAHVESCRRCAEALAGLPIHAGLLESIRELQVVRENERSAMDRLAMDEDRVTSTLFT